MTEIQKLQKALEELLEKNPLPSGWGKSKRTEEMTTEELIAENWKLAREIASLRCKIYELQSRPTYVPPTYYPPYDRVWCGQPNSTGNPPY